MAYKISGMTLQMLENCFLEIQMNINIKKNLDKIVKILNNEFKQHLSIICESADITRGSKDELFGMRVYIAKYDLRSMISDYIHSEANGRARIYRDPKKSYTNYLIEMDDEIFLNKMYKFTPKEMVAILLHEIGHSVLDTRYYEQLMAIYVTALSKLRNAKELSKFTEADYELISMYIVDTLDMTRAGFLQPYDSNSEENADLFVLNSAGEEYAKALATAIQKFNKIYFLNYSKNVQKQSDIIRKQATNYVAMSKLLDQRTKAIYDAIKTEKAKNRSLYVKTLCGDMLKRMKEMPIVGKLIINEGYIVADVSKQVLDENFITNFLLNPIKVSQADIDDLKIESQMMEDYDDKMIMVSKIHKRLTQLARSREKIKDDKKKLVVVENYEKQLNELLSKVMKFKYVEKNYGVFVKYPKGYEG